MISIFKAYYDIYEFNGELLKRCIFLDEENNEIIKDRIYENLEFIHQAENNPNEVYSGGGQGFCWDISAEKVVFYNNEFDEEDGWPDLSCSLHTFKTALIAWNAFLQLPKSIHSVVETVIEE